VIQGACSAPQTHSWILGKKLFPRDWGAKEKVERKNRKRRGGNEGRGGFYPQIYSLRIVHHP